MTLFISILIIRGLGMHPAWYLTATAVWLLRTIIKAGINQ